MKIEIVGIRTTTDLYNIKSGIHRIVLQMRVPKDVDVLCFNTVKDMLNKRQIRINKLNKYRLSKNKTLLSSLPGKQTEQEKVNISFKLVSWSPIINVEKLEILQKYL